jgi:predicted nucleic acid-binding protein
VTFILDASITLAWHFADEKTDSTDKLLLRTAREGAHVPAGWPAEVVNALIIGERRQRCMAAGTDEFLTRLTDFDISVDDQATAASFSTLPDLSRKHRLTAYDATYLELAMRLQLPLASRNDALIRAAQRVGLELI